MRWYIFAGVAGVVLSLFAGAAVWLWTTAPVTLPDDRPVGKPVVGKLSPLVQLSDDDSPVVTVGEPTPPPMSLANEKAEEAPPIRVESQKNSLLVRREEYGNCSYNRGYRDGWKEGVRAAMQRELNNADSTLSSVSVPLWAAGLGTGVSGVVFGLLGFLLGRRRTPLKYCFKPRNPRPKTRKSAALLLCVALLSSGCSAFQRDAAGEPPVPMPPLKPAPETPQGVAVQQQAQQGTPLSVEVPTPPSSGPRIGDPDPLITLLEMESVAPSADESAVKKLRPQAIHEAAHMVTLQTAIAWRYKHLLDAVYAHAPIMDAAFNFGPLMMTQGDALIMPPVLARAGASLRIEDEGTATAASTSFELLQKAKYVSVAPHWRTYLMADGFPEPELPNPAVLPKNSKERAIWRAAVREAWAQGLTEADQIFQDNLARMTRDYRGVLLYHLLTAQHLMSRVRTARADMGLHISSKGTRLNIGQKVYRITAPGAFSVPAAPKAAKKGKRRR